MIRTFTEAEMLKIWKNKLGLFESSSGGVVTRQDGTNLDDYLIEEIRSWYADTLRNADPELLPIEDLASEAVAVYVEASHAEMMFPERGIRLVGIKLNEWQSEICKFYSPNSDMARLQKVALLRATSSCPVVIVDKRKIDIYGVVVPQYELAEAAAQSRGINFSPSISSLRMVAYPADGTYVFDDSLLFSAN